MLHFTRANKIDDKSDLTIEEFSELLTEYTHLCCQGYRYKDLVFLNDATSEDGAQEFAVLRGNEQIESITASWSSPHSMAICIEGLLINNAHLPVLARVDVYEHPPGYCAHCR